MPGVTASEAFCVVFVEDLRSVQARMRQEKLAAMGRVSAGIAHEIRNPLAAIAQANALLSEEAVGAEQKMLTAMVADNVERLKRLVDDVMEVAPGIDATPRTIDLGAEVGRIVADWARTSAFELGGGSRLQVDLPQRPLAVLFDPGAPAPRARQPARQRAPLRQRSPRCHRIARRNIGRHAGAVVVGQRW